MTRKEFFIRIGISLVAFPIIGKIVAKKVERPGLTGKPFTVIFKKEYYKRYPFIPSECLTVVSTEEIIPGKMKVTFDNGTTMIWNKPI